MEVTFMQTERRTADEQYRLIMECRSSGLSDFQWCNEHGIKPGTFYNWVKRLRKKSCYDIPPATGRGGYKPSEQQDVVKLEIVDQPVLHEETPQLLNHPVCGRCIMLGDITAATDIYIICGYTDMRKSIDGLCAIIRDQLHFEPEHTTALYLFCGRRNDRIKALLHENDGFVLLYKRLDHNTGKYRWPRNRDEVKTITWRQFDWLMSGLEIEQPKAIKSA